MNTVPFDPSQYIWPMVFLLASVYLIRLFRTDFHPIFSNVISGVADGAKSNATAYGIAIMFGLSASLSAFVDVFKDLSVQSFHVLSVHQYLALWAKVLNPFVVAILAYATQNKFRGGGLGATSPDSKSVQ